MSGDSVGARSCVKMNRVRVHCRTLLITRDESRSLHETCVGERLVSWPHLLGEVVQRILLLDLVEVERQQELLEIDEEWEEKVECNGEFKVEEWTPTSCMDEMRQTRGHLEPRDVCVGMVTTSDWTRLTTLCAHSRVHHVKCRVSCALCWSWFSRCHWCQTSHRSVSPRIRNSKFSSWCCCLTLSCHRQLRL